MVVGHEEGEEAVSCSHLVYVGVAGEGSGTWCERSNFGALVREINGLPTSHTSGHY